MSDFSTSLRPAQPSSQRTLASERSRSDLPVQELTHHLLSHDGFLERHNRILKLIHHESLLQKSQQLHLARPERYKLGLARAKLLRRIGRKHGWSKQDYDMAEYLVDEMSPYHLQLSMFVTTIQQQGDDGQRAHWLPLIDEWKILGAYAQTEMGHGSNVRGLECQAVYDTSSQQWTIHSPTITASKWWNGSMGRTATHAIVVAQVYVPSSANKAAPSMPPSFPNNDDATGPSTTSPIQSQTHTNMGPHPFVIQIRDLQTHKPLPGVIVGDIGPKYGYASMDNGYLLFSNYKVPHSALLARYSQVDPQTGEYHKPSNPSLIYGSLTSVRAHIIMHARLVLARAVTIAVRYTSVRRQFPERDTKNPAAPETQVLDYPTVAVRLLPLLATTFALHYTGRAISTLYATSRARIEERQDLGLLSALHAQSSALKSQATEYAANGIETCRRACGGHGFGGYSGFVALNADYLSKVTVEGDNWMITAQAGRWLVKRVGDAHARLESVKWDARKAGTIEGDAAETGDWIQPAVMRLLMLQRSGSRVKTEYRVLTSSVGIMGAFTQRAAGMAVRVWRELKGGKKEREVSVLMHEASNAFAQALLVRNWYTALQLPEESPDAPPKGVAEVMHTLFRLYSLHTLHAHALSFLSASPPLVTMSDVNAIPGVLQELMAQVRPHAVRLVDAWAIPDFLLDSALGDSKGDVYERVWDWAHKQNPLNDVTVNPWFWEDEIVRGEGAYSAPWGEKGNRAKL